MTTKEEIKTQLNKAEARLEEAVNNLKEFMKENLEKFEKRWRIEELKEEKKRLEKEKVKWGDEVLEWNAISNTKTLKNLKEGDSEDGLHGRDGGLLGIVSYLFSFQVNHNVASRSTLKHKCVDAHVG
ncbi:11758_t:CDS:2, partial [Entrophospora sp. SA101]